MYDLGYAVGFHCNNYRIVEKEITKITHAQFIKRAKEIIKENHPVRFVYLEHDKKGIVALYKDKELSYNKIWKIKNDVKTKKTKQTTVRKPKNK